MMYAVIMLCALSDSVLSIAIPYVDLFQSKVEVRHLTIEVVASPFGGGVSHIHNYLILYMSSV